MASDFVVYVPEDETVVYTDQPGIRSDQKPPVRIKRHYRADHYSDHQDEDEEYNIEEGADEICIEVNPVMYPANFRSKNLKVLVHSHVVGDSSKPELEHSISLID
jgi:hypothetical protein